jgi:hypothetical protein
MMRIYRKTLTCLKQMNSSDKNTLRKSIKLTLKSRSITMSLLIKVSPKMEAKVSKLQQRRVNLTTIQIIVD